MKKAIYNTNDFVNKPFLYKKRVEYNFVLYRKNHGICKTVWIVHWLSMKNVDYVTFILAKLDGALQQVLSL